MSRIRCVIALFVTALSIQVTQSEEFHDDDVLISFSNKLETIPERLNTISLPSLNTIVSVSQEIKNGPSSVVYVSDYHDGASSIYKISSFDSKTLTKVSEESFRLIEDLAFDPDRNVLHILDSKSKSISEIRLDAQDSSPRLLGQFEQGVKLRGLAFDSCNRKLYYGIEDKSGSWIEEHDLDTGKSAKFIILGQAQVRSLSFDPTKSLLYWISITNKDDSFELSKAHVSNPGNQNLMCKSHGQLPMDMSVTETSVFWTDSRNMAVWKSDKNLCSMKIVFRLDSDRPYGITTLRPLSRECTQETFQTFDTSNMTSDQRKENETVSALEGDPCTNFCLQGNCSLTSASIPVCLCREGFFGSRCENSSCQNYCLNNGNCSIATLGPFCDCPKEFEGLRCETQLKRDKVNEGVSVMAFQIVSGLALTFLGSSIFLSIIVWKLFKKPTHSEYSGPSIVKRKRSPSTFSRSRERNGIAKSQNLPQENISCKQNGGEGVVLDLEDCCKMMLCDKPCVEYHAARKQVRPTVPGFRSPSKSLKSSTSSGRDDQEILLDNDAMEENKLF